MALVGGFGAPSIAREAALATDLITAQKARRRGCADMRLDHSLESRMQGGRLR